MNDKTLSLRSEIEFVFKNQPKPPLSFFHLNVQSIWNKFDDLNIFLDGFNFLFDVIMLSETWYKNTEEVDRLENFEIFSANRTNKVGGGVCIHVKRGLECTLISDFTAIRSDYEILTLQHAKTVFSVVYRPPSGNISFFLEFLDVYFKFLGENILTVCFGGDFKIEMLVSSSYKTEL
ncbi:uncharacterized protein LOC120842408, partial [Ixodes scapularis]|uniref:uncharacterized protein LOC120842408 n=1 Tax=Ixodes scapularis TaxID=6945 RepID=UPI001A9E1460